MCTAFRVNPRQSYGASPAIWARTVLATAADTGRHCPVLTPARQAGTRFAYPGGMEGWVDLGSLVIYHDVLAVRRPSPSHPWSSQPDVSGMKIKLRFQNFISSIPASYFGPRKRQLYCFQHRRYFFFVNTIICEQQLHLAWWNFAWAFPLTAYWISRSKVKVKWFFRVHDAA